MITKKYNIFIGEPNSGKSNILESIGIFSALGHKGDLNNFIRINSLTNLFFDESYQEDITIEFMDIKIEFNVVKEFLELNIFNLKDKDSNPNNYSFRNIIDDKRDLSLSDISFDLLEEHDAEFQKLKKVKYYLLPNKDREYVYRGDTLHPPFGENLFDIINGSKKYRNIIRDILKQFNYKLNLNPSHKSIDIAKEVDGIMISHPLNLVADTIISLISYVIAIENNNNAILIFEEPEGHLFPHYIKELAEIIADDKTNEYFITSHNEHFFDTIINKCKPDDIQVNLVYSDNYETKVMQLNSEQLSILQRGDPFFSINELIPSDDIH